VFNESLFNEAEFNESGGQITLPVGGDTPSRIYYIEEDNRTLVIRADVGCEEVRRD
jgi:hypothetical protein